MSDEAQANRSFLRDLLEVHGASVRDEAAVLHAELPEEGPGAELAERLGSELELVFDAEALAPGRQLVAPGSFVLREIEAWLAPQARRSYVIQPGSARLNKKAITAQFKPARGRDLRLERKRAAVGYDLYVLYRVRFRSMARQEELQTVRVRWRPDTEPVADLAEPPADTTDWTLKPRKRASAEVLDAALPEADALAVAGAQREAKLRRTEARKRFGKDVSRLNAYYAAQVAEIMRKRRTDGSQLRVEELEEERTLRLKELAQASEVSAEVEALSLLTVEVPLQLADLVVRRGGEPEGSIPVSLERASEALTLPPCPSCQEELSDRVGACASGHVVHEVCLGRCDRCAGTICGACTSAACGVCEQVSCPGCGSNCEACERPTCSEHGAGTCGLCAAPGCSGCLVTCAACERAACAEHLAAPGLCSECAVTCPGCQEPTDKGGLTRCGTCGRKFCPTCHPQAAPRCVLCG